MGPTWFRIAHYLAFAVAIYVIWLITGCATVTGPCRMEMTAVAEGVGGGSVQCEPGGHVVVWAPSRLVRETGKALSQSLTASAPSAPASAPKEYPPLETTEPPKGP